MNSQVWTPGPDQSRLPSYLIHEASFQKPQLANGLRLLGADCVTQESRFD